MTAQPVLLDPWAPEALSGPPRGGALSNVRESAWAELAERVVSFRRHWEWASSRSPEVWGSLRALLLAGERDERILLDCAVRQGSTGEEVLLVIQACQSFWALSVSAHILMKLPGQPPSQFDPWWAAKEWLPHLGGPFHQQAWGEVRSLTQAGRFRELRDRMDSWVRRASTKALRQDWEAEVRGPMTDYVREAEARFDRTPARPLPPTAEAWLVAVSEADALFMKILERAKATPRKELPRFLWEDRMLSVMTSRWAWLSVAAGWSQPCQTSLQESFLAWPLADCPIAYAVPRFKDQPTLGSLQPLPQYVRPYEFSCYEIALAGDLLEWAGEPGAAQEVYKRWG